MKHEKSQICSICRLRYTGLGNNAWPVNARRCCDNCNWMIVIPARIAMTHPAFGGPEPENKDSEHDQ